MWSARKWTRRSATASSWRTRSPNWTRSAPEPGEEATLAAERTDMQKGERIAGDLGEVVDVFAGSDGALASLRGAARRLDRLAPEHPLLADALASLDRAVIEATEAEDKLAEVGRALPLDPARLDAVETRLFDLRGLARKHRVEPDELAELRACMRDRLDRIEAGGEGLADAGGGGRGRARRLPRGGGRGDGRADGGGRAAGPCSGRRAETAEAGRRALPHGGGAAGRGSVGAARAPTGWRSPCRPTLALRSAR